MIVKCPQTTTWQVPTIFAFIPSLAIGSQFLPVPHHHEQYSHKYPLLIPLQTCAGVSLSSIPKHVFVGSQGSQALGFNNHYQMSLQNVYTDLDSHQWCVGSHLPISSPTLNIKHSNFDNSLGIMRNFFISFINNDFGNFLYIC